MIKLMTVKYGPHLLLEMAQEVVRRNAKLMRLSPQLMLQSNVWTVEIPRTDKAANLDTRVEIKKIETVAIPCVRESDSKEGMLNSMSGTLSGATLGQQKFDKS